MLIKFNNNLIRILIDGFKYEIITYYIGKRMICLKFPLNLAFYFDFKDDEDNYNYIRFRNETTELKARKVGDSFIDYSVMELDKDHNFSLKLKSILYAD